MNDDTISRQSAMELFDRDHAGKYWGRINNDILHEIWSDLKSLPPAQPEDYTEFKQEFLRMASYIDVLLECSDEQKETLIGFISRLAEFMPWTERD